MEKGYAGVRAYRNTAVNDKLPAPAILLQGRYLMDGIPRLTQPLVPSSYNYEKVQIDRDVIQSKQKVCYDGKVGTEYDVLKSDDQIRV